MIDHIRPALATLGLMTVLTGLAYPLALTGLGPVSYTHLTLPTTPYV